MTSRSRPTVAVVGAGIAGLAAAYELACDGRADVVILEGSPRTGGKVLRGEIAGAATDLGAESVLARRPEGVALIGALGLADEVVHPVAMQASIWSRGALRPLPAGHVMGVPTDLRALAASGVVSRAAVARAALDRALPATKLDGDTSVASFIGRRLGRAVVDRLVEPLLGGVYAGRADQLSLRATLPRVAAVAGSGSLLRRLRPFAPVASSGPVFAGLSGGVGRVPEALTTALIARGVDVRLNSAVRELRRDAVGWQLVVGTAAAPAAVAADAVVLAVPAAPASRLLADVSPVAAAELSGVEYASMAIATFAFSRSSVENHLHGSGFLVPAVEKRLIKAATFSSVKWDWYPRDLVVVRCSIGRFGEAAELQRDDRELIGHARRDLASIAGIAAEPVDASITRWGGALPQYAVGHVERVGRIKSAIEAVPSLAICGAAFDGVGIPACIASGQAAATRVLTQLRGGGE